MSEDIKILNPELRSKACCGYGEWFALELLMELWRLSEKERDIYSFGVGTRRCPSCGAEVRVDWETESVWYTPRDEQSAV